MHTRGRGGDVLNVGEPHRFAISCLSIRFLRASANGVFLSRKSSGSEVMNVSPFKTGQIYLPNIFTPLFSDHSAASNAS